MDSTDNEIYFSALNIGKITETNGYLSNSKIRINPSSNTIAMFELQKITQKNEIQNGFTWICDKGVLGVSKEAKKMTLQSNKNERIKKKGRGNYIMHKYNGAHTYNI